MEHSFSRRRPRRRGSAIITALFVVLIVSLLLIGVGTLAVGHEQRCYYDTNWTAALDLAEAGVNYEYKKISNNVAQADSAAAFTLNQPFGVVNTSFSVQCINHSSPQNQPQPWSGPGTNLDVIATGTIAGVSRSIRVATQGFNVNGNYAVYAMKQGSINGNPTVTGNVGTNGAVTLNGNPHIGGSVILNGPGANTVENPAGIAPTQSNPNAINWPTVDSIANAAFPSGGLAWLSTHSDNAMANPAIVNNSVNLNGNKTITFVGKPGGANYYLTNLTMNGNTTIIFNNAAGPINIWFGPDGGNGTIDINGGTASVKMSADPSKTCIIYNAENSSVNLNGNSELDAGVYAYNGANGGQVNFNGTGNIDGEVISNTFSFNGTPDVTAVSGYFSAGNGYYGFANSWIETNPR